MKLMQRSSVLLPEPEAPRMAMRSPRATSRSMPRSTSTPPKCFRRPETPSSGASMLVGPRQPPLERVGCLDEGKQQQEERDRDHRVDLDRIEIQRCEQLALLEQFDVR